MLTHLYVIDVLGNVWLHNKKKRASTAGVVHLLLFMLTSLSFHVRVYMYITLYSTFLQKIFFMRVCCVTYVIIPQSEVD